MLRVHRSLILHRSFSSRATQGRARTPPRPSVQRRHGRPLFAIPIICALIGIVWGIDIVRSDEAPNVVAGHVLAGIGLVCASLVALVASVVRQIQNTYSEADRRFWPWWSSSWAPSTSLGSLPADFPVQPGHHRPGFVLIGLGIVCYSIPEQGPLVGAGVAASLSPRQAHPPHPVLTA